MNELFCNIHTAESVAGFLEYLNLGGAQWQGARRGELAFRGQASSQWPLVPTAFRENQVIGYDANTRMASPTHVVSQARREFRALIQFVKEADESGLPIPAFGGQILLQDNPIRLFGDSDWEFRWPPQDVYETLALAQHHGVPTRLLDFTSDYLVAAFFAAYYAWDPMKGALEEEGADRDFLSVWVVDLRFIRAVNGIRSRYPERVGEIKVPRSANSYLHAQSGLFLIDRGASDVMAGGELLSIDKAIASRANFWHTGERLAGNRISQNWFNDLPIMQVRLSTTFTSALLNELSKQGITRASVMPSLDRVVESLEFQRTIPQ